MRTHAPENQTPPLFPGRADRHGQPIESLNTHQGASASRKCGSGLSEPRQESGRRRARIAEKIEVEVGRALRARLVEALRIQIST